MATDGTRSAFAVSKRLTVPEKRPGLSVQSPRPGQRFPADQPITLCGHAVDVAGASLPEELLTWRLDGKDPARGTRFALAEGLGPGEHRVTLRDRPAASAAVDAPVTFAVARRSREQLLLRRLLAQQP